MIAYTEEDALVYMAENDKNFRMLLERFELELDFTKKPPVRKKQQ